MPVIVLDVGSSFLKSAVADLARAELSDVRRVPMPAGVASRSNRHELDPVELRDRVADQLSAHRAARPDVHGVLISTQMHCFVLTDRSGRPVGPIITWQDRRSTEPARGAARAAVDRLYAEGQERRSRVPLRPGLPLASFAHWLDERGPVAGLEFHTLGSYLIRSLTGAHATHLSNAAATGMVTLATGWWDDRVIAAIGADEIAFPSIASGPVGRWRDGATDVPVWADLGDHQTALYGVRAEPGDIVISLGTAGLVTRLTDDPATRAGTELRPSIDGRLLRTVTGLPAGRYLQHWVDRVAGADAAAGWERLAVSLPEEVAGELDEAYGSALARLTSPGESVPRLHVTGGLARLPALAERLDRLVRRHASLVHRGDATLAGLVRVACETDAVAPARSAG